MLLLVGGTEWMVLTLFFAWATDTFIRVAEPEAATTDDPITTSWPGESKQDWKEQKSSWLGTSRTRKANLVIDGKLVYSTRWRSCPWSSPCYKMRTCWSLVDRPGSPERPNRSQWSWRVHQCYTRCWQDLDVVFSNVLRIFYILFPGTHWLNHSRKTFEFRALARVEPAK